MTIKLRMVAACRAALTHLIACLFVATVAAALVFLVWYPFPYRELAGGRDLFLLIIGVDVVCGPVLTLVIFNPSKPRGELIRDIGLVALIQITALGYGLWTVWEARPLYMVAEIDRFKVISAPDLRGASLTDLPSTIRTSFFTGPITVAIRLPKDDEEKRRVMFESIQGGPDFAERPGFYLPYVGTDAARSMSRARELSAFLDEHPERRVDADAIAVKSRIPVEKLKYLPIIARQAWIAILDDKAMVIGFLKGDGF